MKKLKVGILGATGMVGQRFIMLLTDHDWFEIVEIAASPRSRGKMYAEAVSSRWAMSDPIPTRIGSMRVKDVTEDLDVIAASVDLVFCALDLDKAAIQQIEIAYAAAGVPVVSNNSAHRWTSDVPMLIPEINPDHAKVIQQQRKTRGWDTGLIAVKPNCSIQTYVPVLSALAKFEPTTVSVTSLQAVSGAGKTLSSWLEMSDNVIPYIGGEEDKSEKEPLKIWGTLRDGSILSAKSPSIQATCIRVPVSNGHLASVTVSFSKNPSREQIIEAVTNFENPLAALGLPSAPRQFITYMEQLDRPQTKLDRDTENGMGVTMGRLRHNDHFGWTFIALSHNTIRGAAGGAVLMAELLVAKGYIKALTDSKLVKNA